MQALYYTEYGSPDVLQLREIDIPSPKDDEVLVQIDSVSLNASDWELLSGKPLYARLYGLRKPRINILGSDIAGRVTAVGKNVTRFRLGDEVFGDIFDHFGGLAENVCAPESCLTIKPKGMTFTFAAAIPQAACIAYQGLHQGKIESGKKILINGAGGGAGSFAIQIAKYYNAEVTAVDSSEKLTMMRALGADYVIDYSQEDFTQNGKRYDLIFDLSAHHGFLDYKRALSPKGVYLMVGGSMALMFKILFLGSVASLFGNKKMRLFVLKKNLNIANILELIEQENISPVIDRCYKLLDSAQALQYLGEGHAKGKIIVTNTNRTPSEYPYT